VNAEELARLVADAVSAEALDEVALLEDQEDRSNRSKRNESARLTMAERERCE
jgi:hypothetical protein